MAAPILDDHELVLEYSMDSRNIDRIMEVWVLESSFDVDCE